MDREHSPGVPGSSGGPDLRLYEAEARVIRSGVLGSDDHLALARLDLIKRGAGVRLIFAEHLDELQQGYELGEKLWEATA